MSELVFVYGTLKRDGANHVYIQQSEGVYVAKAWLKGWKLLDCGSFPTAAEADYRYRIKGEIYMVELMDILDILEGYPDFYQRRLVKTDLGKVWLYYQTNPFGDEIPGGIWNNATSIAA